MGKYIIRRALQAIPVIFLIAVVSFLLMQAAPGGPAAAVQPEPPDQRGADRRRGSPAGASRRTRTSSASLREFGGWLGVWNCEGGTASGSFFDPHGHAQLPARGLGGGTNGILHGDFGYSIFTGRPVLDMIGERIPATLVLMITAFVIWVTVAIVIGVIAAVKRYSLFDQSVTLFSYIFYSLPTFWLGLILIFMFAVGFHWLPSQGIVDTRGARRRVQHPALLGRLLGEPCRQHRSTSAGT